MPIHHFFLFGIYRKLLGLLELYTMQLDQLEATSVNMIAPKEVQFRALTLNLFYLSLKLSV